MRQTFQCIDAHTCGNPVRLVVQGGPQLAGKTMMEKRQHFINNYDWIRRGLMFEPRGHDMMSGSILYPPADPSNDIGIIFIETSGCLPMCGHGTIGTVTMMLEEKLVTPKSDGILNIETPAGLIQVTYLYDGKKIKSVKIINVPSFLYKSQISVKSKYLGELHIDIAYGGNFYAIVEKQEHYPGMNAFTAAQLIAFSRDIRDQINLKFKCEHPEDPTISGVSHVLWTGDPRDEGSCGRNAVFYGDKAIDRSPCGTGTSARMAQLHANGLLKEGESFIHESYIGSKFKGKVERVTNVGHFKAIIPSIEGWAKITGYNNIIIDTEDDPFALGFQVI